MGNFAGGPVKAQHAFKPGDLREGLLGRRAQGGSRCAVQGHLETGGHGLGSNCYGFRHGIKKAPRLPVEPVKGLD